LRRFADIVVEDLRVHAPTSHGPGEQLPLVATWIAV
jgi:hypothetical protein